MRPCCSFLIICILLFSCKKDTGLHPTGTVSNFGQIFDLFWNGVNVNYVYWDIDTTNWDRIYVEFKPKFEKLNLQDSADIQEAVLYFLEMTHSLLDGHFYITFDTPLLSGLTIYPASDRKQYSPTFHLPYSYINLDSVYLDQGYKYGFDSVDVINNLPLEVACGTIDKKILYFSCNEFSLFDSYASSIQNTVQPVLQAFFSALQSPPPNMKGIIVDVRDNYGGDLNDLDFLLGRFIDGELPFGVTRYKSNTGRLDYTPWIEAAIAPQPGAKAIDMPVIVLADNYSISLAEAVVMATHALPHGSFVGETTWGATGPLVAHDIYNDGQFTVPGFLTVHTSSAEFRYKDGKCYEGIGFPPDVYVPFDMSAISVGKDITLEKAISLFP